MTKFQERLAFLDKALTKVNTRQVEYNARRQSSSFVVPNRFIRGLPYQLSDNVSKLVYNSEEHVVELAPNALTSTQERWDSGEVDEVIGDVEEIIDDQMWEKLRV